MLTVTKNDEGAPAAGSGESSGSVLDEIVRDDARRMLAAALEAEVAAYIDEHTDQVDEHGRRLVVRNGHHVPREVLTSSGAIGVVAPRQLVFDNATGVGRRTGEAVVESKLFASFKLHYRCTARYCNPYSGNEKGNVENAVGFLRRNLMVPEPEAATLAGLNQVLLARCDQLGAKQHWRKQVPIKQLFDQDVAACLALPGAGFDPVRYESRTADKTGNLLIDGNTYCAGPSFGGRRVTVGIRHDRIEILDEHAEPVVSLTRAFGHQPGTIFEAASLLPLLVRKPGAWGNSPVRELVTDPVRAWLDAATARDRRQVLAAINTATGSAGFESAVQAADTLIRRGDTPGADAIGMLARRLAAGTEPATGIVNLHVYDGLAHTHEASDATGAGGQEQERPA